MLPSGNATRALDRAKWAIMFLSRADFIKPVRRGVYSITEIGREWNAQLARPVTDLKSIERELGAVWKANTPTDGTGLEDVPALNLAEGANDGVGEAQTPTQQLEVGVQRLEE